MGRKKKFIDKRKSATFQLLARDSSDPNYTESPGGDRVFVRVDNNPYSVDTFFPEDKAGNDHCDEDPSSIFADAPEDDGDIDDAAFGNSVKFHWGDGGTTSEKTAPLPEHVRKEILELGFPDDGYNYLIHLREIKNTGGGSAFFHNAKAKLGQLPHDVKAYDASRVRVSEVKSDDENDKSMYSVASKTVGVRVQKAVDLDVVALLEDSDLSRFGSDVEDLEEDFVVCANLPDEAEGVDADEELNLIEESEVINETVYQHGTSSRYNICQEKVGSSSVKAEDSFVGDNPHARRILDEQFDLLERQEYGSDDEDDEYGGYLTEEDQSLANKLKHAPNEHAVDDLELGDKYEGPADLLHGKEKPKSKELLDSAADVIRRCVEYAERYENEDEDENVFVLQESSDESEDWDCETIVSTYSNLDNHPAKIETPGTVRKKKLVETVSGFNNNHMILLRGKEKLPVDFLPHGRKSATENLKGVPGLKTEQQKRKQHGQESKEEKKERKAAVKEERRVARQMKKEMKGLYRSEAQHAQRVAAIAGPSSVHLM